MAEIIFKILSTQGSIYVDEVLIFINVISPTKKSLMENDYIRFNPQ